MRIKASFAIVAGLVLGFSTVSAAQPLGTFRWQLSPYCNVLSLSVTQNGAIYRLEGYDDQCGANTRAAVIGMAIPNTDGTIGFGLNLVVAPGGAPLHIDVALTPATLGGTWRDSSGNTGTLVFNPSAAAGTPRAAPTTVIPDGAITSSKIATNAIDASKVLDGSLGSADVNSTQIQRRVSGACATGAFLQGVNQDGTVVCGSDSTGTGDITGVAAGTGLSGGGTSGDVTLTVNFDGTGTAATAARSDHTHPADITGVAAGAGLAGGGTAGDVTLAVSYAGSGTATTAARSDHTHAADITGVAAGAGLTGGGTAGDVTLAANFAGPGTANAIARSDHDHRGTDASNTAIGLAALAAVTTGLQNTAIGSQALTATTTGGGNVAVGQFALSTNTTGTSNTALGWNALGFATTAAANTAVGSEALTAATTGGTNVALGVQALRNSTAGTENTAVGVLALSNMVSGLQNVAVGVSALGNALGNNNIAIGSAAGATLTNGDNNIYIGNAGAVEAGRIRIGGVVHTATFIAGIRGATTGVNDAVAVVIDSDGQLGTVSSSRRVKEDIAPLTAGVDLQRLRPVQFRYIAPSKDGSKPLQYGFIAEEVAEVNPLLVARGADGQIETVKYHILPTLLVAEVQRLENERVHQEERITALSQAVEELRAALARLTAPR